MRYVIVSILKGNAGKFNNELRGELYRKFKVKSSKLPAHFTIKAPFEYNENIEDVEKVIENYCNSHKKQEYIVEGIDHFDERVIYMNVKMNEASRRLHDDLIDELMKISYLNFGQLDGKNKKIHVTIASKKIKNTFHTLWEYVNKKNFSFKEDFDNISIYQWKEDNWTLYKEYKMKIK